MENLNQFLNTDIKNFAPSREETRASFHANAAHVKMIRILANYHRVPMKKIFYDAIDAYIKAHKEEIIKAIDAHLTNVTNGK